ncbi:hypothetical protein [Aquella oligotrophica]|uniref:Polysaccharide chain length determinant N-terminal domain-containing protein n=1 Tax=Aquella oligotrophica TaxID=2067065 RepID=A0A2I7N2S7_9NEIS|nr:hypothetical protein [Aquella oligotrophica]AUR50749.1 hypothetical protein CUN60_00040 [Aquella oligotrophica]
MKTINLYKVINIICREGMKIVLVVFVSLLIAMLFCHSHKPQINYLASSLVSMKPFIGHYSTKQQNQMRDKDVIELAKILDSKYIQMEVVGSLNLKNHYSVPTFLHATQILKKNTIIALSQSNQYSISVLDSNPSVAQKILQNYFFRINQLMPSATISLGRIQISSLSLYPSKKLIIFTSGFLSFVFILVIILIINRKDYIE